MPDLRATKNLEEATAYRFEGIYYREYHESGLIPETYIGPEYLDLQKIEAFCVRVAFDCHTVLEPPFLKQLESGDRVGIARVVAVYEGEAGFAGETDHNQCRLGTVRIVGLRKVHPP